MKLEETVCLGSRDGSFLKIFLSFLIVFGAGVVIFGYFLECFTFTFEGLAGWALREKAIKTYSLWELGI